MIRKVCKVSEGSKFRIEYMIAVLEKTWRKMCETATEFLSLGRPRNKDLIGNG
jgi:hypothetical protein